MILKENLSNLYAASGQQTFSSKLPLIESSMRCGLTKAGGRRKYEKLGSWRKKYRRSVF